MRLIDADALIPLIQEEKIEGEILNIIKALGDGLQAETLNQTCDRHIKIISTSPTIDAVPVKHGRWIPTHDRGVFSHPYSITYVCSECGNSIYTLMGMPQVTEYCSKCGARMDEE